MIREPQRSDADRLVDLTAEVYGTFMAKHGTPIDYANLMTTVRNFIDLKQCLVVERDETIVGIAAWSMFPHPANFSCKIFQEVLWCLKSPNVMDASILLKAIMGKARELKADIMILANLSIENESKLKRIYGKRGFKYLETHYAKSIGG